MKEIVTSFGVYFRSDWELVPLPEYVFFQEGPGLRKWQWSEAGMKVINVTNIMSDGSVNTSNTDRYISLEEFEARYAHFAVENGDIVVASSGNTYGKVGRINSSHLPLMMNTSVIRFHPLSENKLNADFLYAFLRSPLFRNQVENFVIGSAQPNFGPAHLKHMKILLPPREEQCRIAAVLSAYDDLIENNSQRIKALEAAAQALYREWFVEFRFPGHESVEWVESELGRIPKGWEVVTISDLYQTSSGGTPSRKIPEYFGGDIRWVKSQELRNSFIFETEEHITELAIQNSSAKLFAPKTVLIAMYGATIGQLAILAETAATNQACCAFLPRKDAFGHAYIYLYLLSNRREIIGLGMGAAQQNISQQVIKAFPILQPSTSTMLSFNDMVNPWLDQIKVLQRKKAILREARDLLLPRLISGEVSAENIEVR